MKIKNFITKAVIFLMVSTWVQVLYAGPVIEFDENSWLKINYEAQFYGKYRDNGSGPENKDSTMDLYFRRNRLIFNGKMNDIIGFNFSVEQHGTKKINDFAMDVSDKPIELFGVLDAFFKADFADAFRLKIGLSKDPMVREQNEGCFFALSADRSFFIYQPLPRANRDYGIVAWGNLFKAILQYKLAVMEGFEGENDPTGASLRYTGRLHISLLDPEFAETYAASYLGYGKILTIGGGYQYEPKAVYANTEGKTGAKDYKAWTVDAFFEYPTPAGTFSVLGAFMVVDLEDAYQGYQPDANAVTLMGQRNGWQARLGYLLPGVIGVGKIQLFGRYEEWKYATLLGVYNQKVKWTAGGINYYIVKGMSGDEDDKDDDEKPGKGKSIYQSFKEQAVRVTLEYAQAAFDKEEGNSKGYKTVTLMFQLMF
jgi:hypothetical protein